MVFTLAAMSVDQWMLIHRSLTYHLHITTTKTVYVNLAIWIASFVAYSPYFFDYFEYAYITYAHICLIDTLRICSRLVVTVTRFIVFVPSFLTILVCNIWTCKTAHSHIRKIRLQQHNYRPESNLVVLSSTRPVYKHFKTTLLIITAFIITSGPSFVLQFLYPLTTIRNFNHKLFFYAEWSLISGSYIYFFVCVCTNRAVRKALKQVVNKLPKCTSSAFLKRPTSNEFKASISKYWCWSQDTNCQKRVNTNQRKNETTTLGLYESKWERERERERKRERQPFRSTFINSARQCRSKKKMNVFWVTFVLLVCTQLSTDAANSLLFLRTANTMIRVLTPQCWSGLFVLNAGIFCCDTYGQNKICQLWQVFSVFINPSLQVCDMTFVKVCLLCK